MILDLLQRVTGNHLSERVMVITVALKTRLEEDNSGSMEACWADHAIIQIRTRNGVDEGSGET